MTANNPFVRDEVTQLTEAIAKALNQSTHDLAQIKSYNKIDVYGEWGIYEIRVRLPMEEVELRDHRHRLKQRQVARYKP